MTDELEDTANRIAEQGREALLARLRPAFADAASAHADVLELSDEQIEQMVQRAADSADGLQWRHALASVATEQLGIGLGEALGHPAVARAQAIVGAPSYEQSLAELGVKREPQREPDSDGEGDLAADEDAEAQVVAEPSTDVEVQASEVVLEEIEEPPDLTSDAQDERTVLRIAAVHLGGIANLAPDEVNVELLLSEDGLDIARGGGEILGRLTWREIEELDVAASRGVRRRRRRDAQLVVRTGQGQASFQVPAMTPEELRERLAPMLEHQQQS